MKNTTKTTAKDFFMQLGLMTALYAGTIALLNLLFRIINVAYPQIDAYYRSFGTNISFPVATLIVVFPLFLVLANIINKGYIKDPSKKEFAVRNWLVYITLFIAGIIIVGDLVTLLYFFLDGRELTTGFLLKVLAVAVVGGSIFGYFLDDLRNKLTSSRRNIWRIIATVLVVGSIVLGFTVLGSPKSQRLARYDEQKVTDLQNIQSQIISYWQTKEALPQSLDDLSDSLSRFGTAPIDTQNNVSYGYKLIGPLSFELCTDFNLKSVGDFQKGRISPPFYDGGIEYENWQHEQGEHCFQRTIDPDRYQVLPKIVR